MKIVIFAGGTGRRLWPLSRQSSPKQFGAIMGEKSTIQLAVDRVLPIYGAENIFLSTNKRYRHILQEQLPQLPVANLIAEPERRDLAGAVGLAFAHLASQLGEQARHDEPVAILWGDNLMDDVAAFQQILDVAQTAVKNNQAQIVFMGETPRYANENLGWIELGRKLGAAAGHPYYERKSFVYRPPLEQCQQMFSTGNWVWNTGYFVTTVGFIQELYHRHMPQMAAQLDQIQAAIGTAEYEYTLNKIYPQLETISFDDAILVHIKPEQAAVLHGKMGWSDPGTLYALKEAVKPDKNDNMVQGLVLDQDSHDCLLYNDEEGKLLAVIGLEGMVVVNTADALLVVHKDDVPRVKQLVNSLVGSELERFS
jgi:mannose-1-phosphate guanylyltransferase